MFQFPGFPRDELSFSLIRILPLRRMGFPIQTSVDQWICAPPHSFSQLVTSFFGSQCQGIHLMPFFAWPLGPRFGSHKSCQITLDL